MEAILRNTDGRSTLARRRTHSNRHKRMRALAHAVPGRIERLLNVLWFKRERTLFAQPERFEPPAPRKQSLLRRVLDHWRGDSNEGWPDPEQYHVYMRVEEAKGTARWAYRNLKRAWKALRHAG